jgi:hypothetical protein
MAHVVTLQLLALVMQPDVYMSDACRHGQLIQLAQYTSARIGLNHCAVAAVGRVLALADMSTITALQLLALGELKLACPPSLHCWLWLTHIGMSTIAALCSFWLL